jgi:hypothetical protein
MKKNLMIRILKDFEAQQEIIAQKMKETKDEEEQLSLFDTYMA